jgi:hypothetical protein
MGGRGEGRKSRAGGPPHKAYSIWYKRPSGEKTVSMRS